MKSFVYTLFLITLVSVPAVSFGQSPAPAKSESGNGATLSAATLYQDANSYLHRRYVEFNKQNLPYDPKLEEKVKQEQKDLAVKNAAVLAAREPLAGEDLYYLGMLHHLANNSEAALKAMRRYLSDASGSKAQEARAVVVVHALRQDLLAEAQSATERYEKSEPVSVQELYGMHTLLTDYHFKRKQFAEVIVHARKMMDIAQRASQAKQVENLKRDEWLFKGGSFLAQAQSQSNDQKAALETLRELRRLSVTLPSGNLYRMVRLRLSGIDKTGESANSLETETVTNAPAPELKLPVEWIGREATTLAQLKGKVVLLDFWAPWCGPCRVTLPQLQRWHEAYADKGLVILGLTNYSGNVDGKDLTRKEELAYLEDFRKRNRLSYGIGVTSTTVNDAAYGVVSIPMSFLVDRQGNMRFVSVGANEQELAGLGRMIKRLIDEPARGPATSTAAVPLDVKK